MTDRDIMQQALEALESFREISDFTPAQAVHAITALRTAIEQAEKQEPVALETVYETIIHWDEGGGKRSRRELARRIVDLYTTPPAAQRQPLTEKRIEELYSFWVVDCQDIVGFARAVERTVKGEA